MRVTDRFYNSAFNNSMRGNPLFLGVTLGTVVSTNDPQEMGRLFILCPELGDSPDLTPEDFEKLPLASYCGAFGGSYDSRIVRGPESDPKTNGTPGTVASGLWGTPKKGATAAVMCVDGNPSQRIWIGCIPDQLSIATLPHGRFIEKEDGTQDGPLSSTEDPIQPLYNNLKKAFGDKKGNYEWRSRGADFQATGVQSAYLDESPSNRVDETETKVAQKDGTTLYVTQGYGVSRDQTDGGDVYDNQVYSWTTPGFHSISMDDREENCRIKIRTTGGKQFILDDTNERIYLNTSQGAVWIELDENGCLDVYGAEKLSFSGKHLNFTAQESIRMYSKKDIHFRADENIRMYSEKKLDIIIKDDARVTAKNINLNSTESIYQYSIGNNETLSEKLIIETGKEIHMNGPTAKEAKKPEKAAYTNRIPQHEPWARVGTKDDTTTEPKYPYDDPMIGREHGKRGKNWRR